MVCNLIFSTCSCQFHFCTIFLKYSHAFTIYLFHLFSLLIFTSFQRICVHIILWQFWKYVISLHLHMIILKTHTFLCNVDVPWVRVSLQNKKSSPARHPSFHILACQSSLYLERERCQIRNRFRTPFLSVNTEFKQWVCLERLTG